MCFADVPCKKIIMLWCWSLYWQRFDFGVQRVTSAPVATDSAASAMTPSVWKANTHSSREHTEGYNKRSKVTTKSLKCKEEAKLFILYNKLAWHTMLVLWFIGVMGMPTFNIAPFWKTWASSQTTQNSFNVGILCLAYWYTYKLPRASHINTKVKYNAAGNSNL